MLNKIFLQIFHHTISRYFIIFINGFSHFFMHWKYLIPTILSEKLILNHLIKARIYLLMFCVL